MQKALRLLATAALSGLVAFAAATNPGCSSPGTSTDGGNGDGGGSACTAGWAACHCITKADCVPDHAGQKFVCSGIHSCVPICASAADCSPGQVCEDAICRPPGCGADSECQSGQQCVGGTCTSRVTPSQVTACTVQPAAAILHAGATHSFSILATDASGKTLPYKATAGEVTWTADAAIGTSMDTGAFATVTGAATAGKGNVSAKIGAVTCTPSAVTNFAAVTDGSFRVTVASTGDHSLITDATVVVGGATQAVDAASSQYLGVNSSDVIVYLKPQLAPGKATGTVTPATFAGLSDIKGTVHLAINGPSIAGNLIDLSLTTLLGQSVPTHIDLGGSTKVDVNLPDGIAIGLGTQMFKGSYSVQSDPGLRAVWALGGNVVLSDVLGVVSSATGGGSIDIGSVLSALLPVVGKLQSGVTTGKTFVPGDSGMITENLDTLLRLQTVAQVPQLPMGFDGAVVIGGALDVPQGFVPLGLTAGVDKHTGSSTTDMMPDGIIDPVGMNGQPGQLPLRFAALHGGLEGSKYATVALSANLSGLLGGLAGGKGTGTGAMKTPLKLSARVVFPGDIQFKNNGTPANLITIPAFLPVPTTLTLDEANRNLLASNEAKADLFRFDLTTDAGGEWHIYFPPSMADGTTPIALPTPPMPFEDRLTMTDAATMLKKPTTTLQSVSLKGKTGVDYKSVLTFDGDNIDDLTASTDAFSANGIVR
jgi:hypothetical protein